MKKIFLTLATVIALTACGGGTPTPTGDAEKDAKAVMEYMVKEVEACKTLDDLTKFEDKVKPVMEAFEKYEAEHPEYKEQFEKAGEKVSKDFEKTIEKKTQELLGGK